MFLPLVLSMLVILLSFGFLISGITTVTPLFVNRDNAREILPMALKAAKINIGLMVVSIILVVIAQDTAIGDSPLLTVSIGFLLWALATFGLNLLRQKSLERRA